MKTWIELEEKTDEASIQEKHVINERFEELDGRLNSLLGNVIVKKKYSWQTDLEIILQIF